MDWLKLEFLYREYIFFVTEHSVSSYCEAQMSKYAPLATGRTDPQRLEGHRLPQAISAASPLHSNVKVYWFCGEALIAMSVVAWQ